MSPHRDELGRSSAHPRQGLLYGWDYEDERVELAEFSSGSRVLAIAGAGELVSHLASAGHEVTAVGANIAQLEYARRRSQGGDFEPGAAERFLEIGRKLIRAASPAWRRAAVHSLLREHNPAKAQQLWRTRLDNRTFRSILLTTLAPAGLLASLVQHDFSTVVPPHFTDTIRARLEARLGLHSLADNRFAWRLLLGEELPDYRVPVVPDGRIRFVEQDVLSHLEQSPAGSYDAMTLSNIADGASEHLIARIGAEARRVIAPGGPMIVRSFASTLEASAVAAADDERGLVWGSVSIHR